MVDNVELNAGTGGKTIASDEIGGVDHQRVKVQHGEDGVANDVSAASPLPVRDLNVISTDNSTTTPLGISGNFTGTGEDVSEYSTVSIILDSSHDGAVDGMTFEWSTDDTNWDEAHIFTYLTSMGARHFQFPVIAQYFRVNYTNGGTGQTTFRVQTILHTQYIGTTIHRLVDNVDPDRSATLTKSVILAQAAGSGDFIPVQATAAGNFKVDVDEIGGVAPSLNTGVRDAGTQRVTVATDDLVPISAASLPLPSGAATSAAQLPDGHNVAAAGDIAHDAPDSGNPVKIGAVAETTEQTAVADGDRVNLMTDLNGKLVNQPYAVPERSVDGLTAAITGTGDIAVIAAPGAGLRLYITELSISNSHASVGTLVEIKSATTVRKRMYAREDGGGSTHTFPKPLRLGDNEALNAANVTTGSNTYVSASGYIGP